MSKFQELMAKYKDKIIPIKPTVGIYFLFKGDEIVYVGQSLNIFHRVEGHKAEGSKEFDSACFFECPVDKLDEYEIIAIRALAPKYNKAHNYYSLYDIRHRFLKGDRELRDYIIRRMRAGKYSKNTIQSLVEFKFSNKEEQE